MPRYYVENNDQWSVFSTVVDDFLYPFMSWDALADLLIDEAIQNRCRELDEFRKTGRGLNRMDYSEAMNLRKEA